MSVDKWWATNGVEGVLFRTKGDLVEKIRSIINSQPLAHPFNQAEQGFLTAVLSHHHDWVQKMGAGVEHIEVRMNPGSFGSTRGLWIVRSDGSEIDISWVVALKAGGKSTAKQNVCSAARREILDQVLAVRMEQEGQLCPICGSPLLTKTHVDHAPPATFDKIIHGFLASYGHSWESIAVEDCGVYSIFEDRFIAQDWQDYHQQEAQLRLIHANENLSLVKTGFSICELV